MREHALYYLARFPTTSVKLRKVLLRWSARRGMKVEQQQLAELVEDLQNSDYLDDAKFATARASSLLRRGASLLDIRARLAKDGVAREDIEQTLATLTEHEDKEEVELLAALRVLQKKRLGPFRSSLPLSKEQQAKNRQKDMGSLARRGFGWGIVQKVMTASEEDLIEWQKKLEQSR